MEGTKQVNNFISALEKYFPQVIEELKNAEFISESSNIKIENHMETKFDGGYIRNEPSGWVSIAIQIYYRKKEEKHE